MDVMTTSVDSTSGAKLGTVTDSLQDSVSLQGVRNGAATETPNQEDSSMSDSTDTTVTESEDTKVASLDTPIAVLIGIDGVPYAFGTLGDNDVFVAAEAAPDGKIGRFIRDGFSSWVKGQRSVRVLSDAVLALERNRKSTQKSRDALAKLNMDVSHLDAILENLSAQILALQGDDESASDPTEDSGVVVVASEAASTEDSPETEK